MTDEAPDEVSVEIDHTGADLTLNERIAVEEACGGRPFHDLRAEGRSTFLRAVTWVTLRRHDARVTLEEAGEMGVRFDG